MIFLGSLLLAVACGVLSLLAYLRGRKRNGETILLLLVSLPTLVV
jgi:hypothetical protein